MKTKSCNNNHGLILFYELDCPLCIVINSNNTIKKEAQEICNKYNELLTNKIITCAFCGYEYTSGTPTSNHETLTDHIKKCFKHPLNIELIKIRHEIKSISDQFKDLILKLNLL